MALSNEDRVLRLTLIVTFLSALGFLIPYGIFARNAIPPIGLIPAGISAINSLYHFSGQARHGKFNILMDAALAAFFLAMYIAGTITIANHWRLTVLGTYGTIPLFMGFCIHTYLFLRDTRVLEIARFHLRALVSTPQCPHCQRAVLSTWGMTSSGAPSEAASSRHSYAIVKTPAVDEEAAGEAADYRDATPRVSVDETTQLV